MSDDLDYFLVTVNRARPILTEYIEAIMMFLNRAVVLECPHLDVPWFRDRASRVFLSKGQFSDIVFLAAVKLTEILQCLIGPSFSSITV